MSDESTGYKVCTEKILGDVRRERIRQHSLKNAGKFPYTCADSEYSGIPITEGMRLAVLVEEVGEVAHEVNERDAASVIERAHGVDMNRAKYLKQMRNELVQVAAVCIAWCEHLDAKEGEKKESDDEED